MNIRRHFKITSAASTIFSASTRAGSKWSAARITSLQQKAQDAVKKIAEESDIDIVLSTNSVIYVEDALDISDKIIAELNK